MIEMSDSDERKNCVQCFFFDCGKLWEILIFSVIKG